MFDLNNFELSKPAVEAYDFKVVTWADFIGADDLPEGLFARGEKVREELLKDGADASWVVYDPLDNSDGWLMIGAQNEVARETCVRILDNEPDEGPLSKQLWPNWLTEREVA